MTDEYPQALPAGYKLEHYEILRVLGAGGFGITYLARDHKMKRQVAIKEYLPLDCAVREGGRPSVVPRSGRQEEDYIFGLDRFVEEARTLARFQEPAIVRVRDFLQANATAYLVMDYEEGEALSTYLKRAGRMDESTLETTFLPLLRGLDVMHACDFLHRDIKPSNIYLRSAGPPLLLDFGAARQAWGERSRTVTGIVTLGYAPVEQYSQRSRQGPWTDLYALGATMYHCITGQAPPESTERMAARAEGAADPLAPVDDAPAVSCSAALVEVVNWMLQVLPAERPRSVAEVLARWPVIAAPKAAAAALDGEFPPADAATGREPDTAQSPAEPSAAAASTAAASTAAASTAAGDEHAAGAGLGCADPAALETLAAAVDHTPPDVDAEVAAESAIAPSLGELPPTDYPAEPRWEGAPAPPRQGRTNPSDVALAAGELLAKILRRRIRIAWLLALLNGLVALVLAWAQHGNAQWLPAVGRWLATESGAYAGLSGAVFDGFERLTVVPAAAYLNGVVMLALAFAVYNHWRPGAVLLPFVYAGAKLWTWTPALGAAATLAMMLVLYFFVRGARAVLQYHDVCRGLDLHGYSP